MRLGQRDPAKATQDRAIVVSDGRAVAAVVEEAATRLTLAHVEQDGTFAVPPYAFDREPLGSAWLAAGPSGSAATFGWTTDSADPATNCFVVCRARR